MLNSAKHAAAMLSSEKPHTATSQWIEILSGPKYAEEDYEGLPELIESIRLQPTTGATECSRALRKKLKYSSVAGQLRALYILKALVDNCGSRFQVTFANDQLVERLKYMAADPLCDEGVRKKLMLLLLGWSRQFAKDPKMQLVAGLYVACGGGKSAAKSAANEAYTRQQARYSKEATERNDRKMAERLQKDEAKEKERLDKEKAKRRGGKKRVPFDFEKEKPKIKATVADSAAAASALINAVLQVDRTQESVDTPRVTACLAEAKTLRKSIVRYIQILSNDPNGEYIGTLLSTNESILNAIAFYDRASKPIDLDSDDDHEERERTGERERGGDDDAASIRSRMSAFDLRDSEVDKLQERQRVRVDRVNRERALYPDLADLSFAGGSSLVAPMQPTNQTDSRPMTRTLSDYSYSSSSSASDTDDDNPSSRDQRTVASSSTSYAAGSESTNANKSYTQYLDPNERKSKGLLEEGEDDEDPFADSFERESLYSVTTPGIQEKRLDWAEV